MHTFLGVPKCASQTLRDFFNSQKIEVIWHYKHPAVFERIARTDNIICVVRDPIDRIASSYFFAKRGGATEKWNEYFSKFENINDFIDNGLEAIAQTHVHFLPQSTWISPAREPWIMRFDRLQDEIDNLCAYLEINPVQLPQKNVTARDSFALTERNLEIIKRVYHDDFVIYNHNRYKYYNEPI